MDSDEEIVGGARPKRFTRPPAYLEQYEMQYPRGRPVSEPGVSRTMEMPVPAWSLSFHVLHSLVVSVLMARRSCHPVISLPSRLCALSRSLPHLQRLIQLLLPILVSYSTYVTSVQPSKPI